MVEFLPFYFFLFVTFPTFQCRYVYQYQINSQEALKYCAIKQLPANKDT